MLFKKGLISPFLSVTFLTGFFVGAESTPCWSSTPISPSGRVIKLDNDVEKIDIGQTEQVNGGLIYDERAEADINAGKFYDAVNNCSKAINLNPEDLRAYCLRAIAYTKLGEKDRAFDDRTRLIALQEHISLRNSKNEVAKYTELIKCNPKNSKAYSGRAAALMSLNEYKLALSDSSKAISLDPKNKYSFFTRIAAYSALHETAKAAADRRQFDLLDSADKIRLAKSAVIDYSQVLESHPNDTNALVNRARAYFQLARYVECKQDCEALVKAGTNQAEASEMLSCCQREMLRKAKKSEERLPKNVSKNKHSHKARG